MLISRKVIQQSKHPINLKSFHPALPKTQVFFAKNYQELHQKQGDLKSKTLISSAIAALAKNHVSFLLK